MGDVDEKTPEDDENTFTLDCSNVNPFTEPERYEAARVEANRQLDKLRRMVEAHRKSTE